jgi:hypothetical protein
MDPYLISILVEPIVNGMADYAKGNRFYNIDYLQNMPPIRIFGNGVLSFFSKLSTGYWNIFDPTNGFTAIHASLLPHLSLEKISKRYFFESDFLFRLSLVRGVVADVPMKAIYGNEVSNLKVSRVLFEFQYKHFLNFVKRILYNYFLRDMSLASITLLVGVVATSVGLIFGGFSWITGYMWSMPNTFNTVNLITLLILFGVQNLLFFFSYDINSIPRYTVNQGFLKINNRLKQIYFNNNRE